MVGDKKQEKVPRMMRKTSLMLLGALAGAALTMIATQPAVILTGAIAAPSDIYRQLNLFGDIFERVRARAQGPCGTGCGEAVLCRRGVFAA